MGIFQSAHPGLEGKACPRAAPEEGIISARWTPPEIERAIELWKSGVGGQATAAALEAEFGIRRSKCSVIARMARAGLSFQGAPSPQALRAAANAKLARGLVAPPRRKAAPKPAAAPVPRPSPRIAPRPAMGVAIPESKRVAITDLKAGMCRWIAGDPRQDATCCGHAVDVGSPVWCSAHRAIGTVGARPRGIPAMITSNLRKAA